MLFTDGVATVSAFVAPAGLRKPLQGATTMGAVNAYGHVVGETQITVVGEVPARTVKRIAENLVRETQSADGNGSP
jgi:sigma-E factor negative regulatory protein RseB